MANMPQIVGKDRRTEAGGQRNAGVSARAGGSGGSLGRRSRRPGRGFRHQYDGDGHGRDGHAAAVMGEARFHKLETPSDETEVASPVIMPQQNVLQTPIKIF